MWVGLLVGGALLATLAVPQAGRAQDLGGVMDLGGWARNQALTDAARGQAERGRRDGIRQNGAAASARPSPARSRQVCTNARNMIRAGNTDPRMPQLLALCRQGGY